MVALREPGTQLEPVERLTPMQRQALLAYARTGTVDAASRELGITVQTIKNHLSECYRRLGVRSGPQAVYVLMGGEDPEPLPPGHRRRARRTVTTSGMPSMVDGQIWLADLRDVATIGDHEADGSPRATLTECVDFLSYYVQAPGTIRTAEGGPG